MLRGEPAALPELTLTELIDLYLQRHSATVRAKTIITLRERLRYATDAFGTIPLTELQRMSGEVASWRSQLPERSRHGITAALRQTLAAAIRWGYITQNPAVLAGRNPQPAPRGVRIYTRTELDAITAELHPAYAPIPVFAAATGLRPEEWQALERRDIDRRCRLLTVRRTLTDGQVVELGKTGRSLRQVPLSRRALQALDAIPTRLDTPLVFPAPHGGPIQLDNWRRRVWAPAIEASGIPRPPASTTSDPRSHRSRSPPVCPCST
jgi:integrase